MSERPAESSSEYRSPHIEAVSTLLERFNEMDYSTPYDDMLDALTEYLEDEVGDDARVFKDMLILDGRIPSQALYDCSSREALETAQLVPITALSGSK